jgi:hypothetical protein
MPEKKASFIGSGNPRDYLDESTRRIPRMRAATTSDKIRDWMLSLQDNPAINALGMMPQGGIGTASGIIPGNLRKLRLEELLDSGIDPQFTKGYKDAIQGLFRKYPNTSAHLENVNSAYGGSSLGGAKKLSSNTMDGYTYIRGAQKNSARLKSGSLSAKDYNSLFGRAEDEILSPLALNLDSRLNRRPMADFRGIAGHELNHAAQALKNPDRMMNYGTRVGTSDILPWPSRPQELAANVAGAKRIYKPEYISKPESPAYSDRLIKTIDNLPKESQLQLFYDFKTNPKELIEDWNSYFGRNRTAPVIDYLRSLR